MPEVGGWQRFVFTDVVVAILFGAYLRKEIVNKDESRIRRLWVSRDEIRTLRRALRLHSIRIRTHETS
jgi:tmRNA-binding protein